MDVHACLRKAINKVMAETTRKANMHRLAIPDNAGKGLTSWKAVCKCGAKWRCEYDQHGFLQWKPLNDKCEDCPHNNR